MEFPQKKIGQQLRSKNARLYAEDNNVQQGWTPFIRIQRQFSLGFNKGTNEIIQFPLRPADAITIHRSQGLTLDAGIIDFRGCNIPHMHYVALSRFTNPQNVKVLHFNPKGIRQDAQVVEALTTKRTAHSIKLNHIQTSSLSGHRTPRILLHNVRSFPRHKNYFARCSELHNLDFMCLTETRHSNHQQLQIENSQFRYVLSAQGTQQHTHGCLLYSKQCPTAVTTASNSTFQLIKATYTSILEGDLTIVLIYKKPATSQAVNLRIWQEIQEKLIPLLEQTTAATLICGDFNCPTNEALPSFQQYLVTQGYVQLIHAPTTTHGTSIDHAWWLSNNNKVLHVAIQNTFFSDHLPILLFPP